MNGIEKPDVRHSKKTYPIAIQQQIESKSAAAFNAIDLNTDISELIRVGGYLSMDGRVCNPGADHGS